MPVDFRPKTWNIEELSDKENFQPGPSCQCITEEIPGDEGGFDFGISTEKKNCTKHH